ncbi:MAG: ROK family protein [Ferruginibacter sp.]|nr:ROK family protein [Cytophagales bacterium]
MKPLWGIDLGGTKIEGVVLNPTPGIPRVLSRLRIPTEADRGYEHIIGQIGKLIGLLSAETGLRPDRIGIGTPGALDTHTRTLKNSNATSLNGQPFGQDLERALGLPFVIANDANCFALAEARMGAVAEAAPEAPVVFGVIMGSGVGGGVVVDGQVLNGRHAIAGEWGHNFLDESGGPCYCGKVGCVETVLSGPSLQRYYQSVSGQFRKLPEIVERHRQQNDPHATATVQRLTHFFGLGLSVVVNLLDPDAIVLGGGVGNVDLLYTEGVAELRKFVFNSRLDTLVLRPKLGDSAGVFGAALLVR